MNSLASIFQIALLAQQAAQQAAQQQAQQPVDPLQTMWQHISTLDLVEALTFISFGVVCLFYGWRIFKILVTICFGLLGLALGVWANGYLVGGNVIWLAMIFVIVFAIFSVPFMRWGVSLLGALSGGILTAGAWLALGLPQEYVWAGGLIGLIAGGMISFIVFKIAVILFTSLGGSTLMMVGLLAVFYRYMVDARKLEQFVFDYHWFLPALILVPMVAGIVLQYRLSQGAEDLAT
jgi:hypothetical protein